MSDHPTKPFAAGGGASATPQLSVLRAASFALLTQALDAAVANDAGLAVARATLLTPLRMLDALGQEAEAALGDDVIAAERLRLLISLGEPQAPPAAIMSGMLAGENSFSTSKAALASSNIPGSTCAPAVLDMGALTILGLAAGRVGLALGLAEPMIDNVLGLALAAGPAETIARAIASGLTPQQLAALLAGFGGRDSGNRAVSATVAAFLADPCERARWVCLNAIFAQLREDVNSHPWDAAGTGSIVEVTPAAACPGEPVVLRLDITTPSREGALDAAHFLPLLAARRAWVVFAAPGERSLARRALAVNQDNGTVEVRVPAGAHAGWVGFADTDLLRATNSARTALRAAWQQRSAQSPCLRDSPVPVESIPVLSNPPTPPRSPSSRFDGGLPRILEASLLPGVVGIGGSVELRWRTESATEVRIDPTPGAVEPSGSLKIQAAGDHGQIERIVVANNRCGQGTRAPVRCRVRAQIKDLVLEQDGRRSPLIAGQPLDLRATVIPPDVSGPIVLTAGQVVRRLGLDNGQVEVTIPGSVVVNGLAGTLCVLGPGDEVDDERGFGPLEFAEQRQRTVVLLRPAVLDRFFHRVNAFDFGDAVLRSRRALGLNLDLVEPAWVDDEDLTCAGPPDGPDVPATIDLLERLNVLAARHPGLEEALWLAVVPNAGRTQGFHHIEPADGACAVGVCTPDHLTAALNAELPTVEACTERLRVIATLAVDGSVRIESMRVEERLAGPGAPVPNDLVALGVAAGRPRVSQSLRAMTTIKPARLIALLPVTPEIDALELRTSRSEVFAMFRNAFNDDSEPLHLRRVLRSSGQPDVNSVVLTDRTLSWEYDHTRSARATFTVEVGSGGVWNPILNLGPCDTTVELPIAHLAAAARAERVRVVASDGWNAAVGVPGNNRLPAVPLQRALARSGGSGRFWADLNFDSDELGDDRITWHFGRETRIGRYLVLPRGFAGDITLVVEGPEGTLTDRRTITAQGKVNARGTHWPEEARRA